MPVKSVILHPLHLTVFDCHFHQDKTDVASDLCTTITDELISDCEVSYFLRQEKGDGCKREERERERKRLRQRDRDRETERETDMHTCTHAHTHARTHALTHTHTYTKTIYASMLVSQRIYIYYICACIILPSLGILRGNRNLETQSQQIMTATTPPTHFHTHTHETTLK